MKVLVGPSSEVVSEVVKTALEVVGLASSLALWNGSIHG